MMTAIKNAILESCRWEKRPLKGERGNIKKLSEEMHGPGAKGERDRKRSGKGEKKQYGREKWRSASGRRREP